MNMKIIRKTNYLALAAIVMTTSCSMIKPKCQRFKLSDILNREAKNPTLVEYNEEGNCVPTIAGYQKKVNLEHENPDTRYFWIQCKWITETQMDSIVNDFINNPRIVDMD